MVGGGHNTCVWGTNTLCWGAPFHGDGTPNEALMAKTVVTPEPVVERAASIDDIHEGFFSHSCDVTATGSVYCWGYNRSGSVGVLTEAPIARPRELETSPFWW